MVKYERLQAAQRGNWDRITVLEFGNACTLIASTAKSSFTAVNRTLVWCRESKVETLVSWMSI